MELQSIVLRLAAGVAIGATATAASRMATPPPTTVLDVKTSDIPRSAPLEAPQTPFLRPAPRK